MTVMIDYQFPLRPGMMAGLHLPNDLTDAEAAMVEEFIDTLVIPVATSHD